MPKKPTKKPIKAQKKSTKKIVDKKPARRYIRRNTYYIATPGKDASVLAPQPRTMVETIQKHGRVERKSLMRELTKLLHTVQPITRLFSFHRAALMRRKFFTEVKEPVVPLLILAPRQAVPGAVAPKSVIRTPQRVVQATAAS